MNRIQHKEIDLLESQLWYTLLNMGFITSHSCNPQIVAIDGYIIQFVFVYQTLVPSVCKAKTYSGSAQYIELNDFSIPRYQVQILSIDGPVQSVWDSTICDYVFIPSDNSLNSD